MRISPCLRHACLAAQLGFAMAGMSAAGMAAPGEAPCQRIDPTLPRLPEHPCFTARHIALGQVALSWQVSNSRPMIYIYDITGPNYKDPGFYAAHCSGTDTQSCTATVFVENGGRHEWSLKVEAVDGRALHARTALSVPQPEPPVILQTLQSVDFLAPEDRAISWEASSNNGWDGLGLDQAWVEIAPAYAIAFVPRHFPRAGSGATYPISSTDFTATGHFDYRVRDCVKLRSDHPKFCSPSSRGAIRVEVDSFLGDRVIYATAGEALTVNFSTGSGNVRMLASETLLEPVNGAHVALMTSNDYTFPPSRLTPGDHELTLTSCIYPHLTCANRVDLEPSPIDGSVEFGGGPFRYQGDVLGLISPDNLPVYMPVDGYVFFDEAFHGLINPVEQGQELGFVITRAFDTVYVVVDSPMSWELGRDYLLDFEPGTAHPQQGRGQALDIAFDDRGGVWQTKEFANSIEYISADGIAHAIEVPLARTYASTGNTMPVVKPFALWTSPTDSVATPMSVLAERVIVEEGTVIFAQGGGLQPAQTQRRPNHSRVILIDLDAQDEETSVFDDRLCVYNLPADELGDLANNEVLGLTYAAGRIWLAESRGVFTDRPSVISSFVPNRQACGNLLDFSEPSALLNQPLQYCDAGMSAEQDGCIEELVLDDLLHDTKVAHLERDPMDGSIWFTDAKNRILGHVDPRTNRVLDVFEIEDDHSDPYSGVPILGGLPWSLRVGEDAVYLGEYATLHLLRFDKRGRTWSEVHIPVSNRDLNLHSIALDRERHRLWFTLSNESSVPRDPNASTIGYVDTQSWRDYLASEGASRKISGVVYSGLASIPAPPERKGAHQSFRGIEVEPGTGRIALATMWREQITLLQPRPGF